MTILLTTAAAALAVGYLLGRLRPWQHLGHWAGDQVRFAGWADGGFILRLAVAVAFTLTQPQESWRVLRGTTQTPLPAPVRDPDWATRRSAPSAPPAGPHQSQ